MNNKEDLIQIINQKLSEKIRKLESMILETRASNNDTKSSMGDKYETGRKCCSRKLTISRSS